jgi:hypothetical protein
MMLVHTCILQINWYIASCNICKILIFFFKEYSNGACIRYSDICDISAFYFGAVFPFNIGLYDILFITCGFSYYATCNGYFIKPIYIN